MGTSASAFPAKEVMETFERRDRIQYLTGLVDMAAFQSHLQGDDERGQCILDWFYKPEPLSKLDYIERVFTSYPDKSASEIIEVLARRECGLVDPNRNTESK